jgi:N-acetylglucosamine-6-phosphate deacetylase
MRAAFRLFPDRICITSDSLRCCGMPDGEYELGGQQVYLKGRLATLADGTIAGSASNLYDCLLTAIRSGIPAETAVRSATLLPARELGCADRIGSLAPGKLADFVVCRADLTPKTVFLGGEEVK